MRFCTLDVECFYDRKTKYSLSMMSTESFTRDPRFELYGAAIKWGNEKSFWLDEPQLRAYVKTVDWSDVFMLNHHAQWDQFVMSYHYGVIPKMAGCTLSQGRMMLGNHISVSLDSIRSIFGLPPKSTPYGSMEGRHWHELPPHVKAQVAAGSCDEVDSILLIFNRFMAQGFPVEELDVIDSVMKMFTNPCLRADTQMLGQLWQDEETRKANGLTALGLEESDLQSADKFADLLREEGVEPEEKDGKNGPIYAFAKTDQFMRDLLEHDSERVRLLAETRLGVKSTILQTRAETLGWTASRGPLPVYLRYCGASTLRVSGGDGANWLNFKRQSIIRKSILAPDGWLLAPVDASQIEFRCLQHLAGGVDAPALQRLRNGEDPYVGTASKFYKREIYKPGKDDPLKAEMEAMRGMGKQGELMCLGPDTEVLTDRGIKRIVDVSTYDRLWDGVEWIEHQGLIFQGAHTVENFAGVEMTSEHQILCDPQHWLPASSLRNESILCRALGAGSANLPSQVLKSERKADLSKLLSAVRAKLLNILLTLQTCTQAAQHDVLLAQENKLGFGLKNIMATLMYAPIRSTVPACSAASLASTLVAAPIVKMSGMAVAGFKFARSGGEKEDAVNFWRIWLRFLVGTIQNWKLIARTTIRGTNPATCNSQLEGNRCETGEASSSLSRKSLTFDLAFAGPRNRFTILSERGPLIVHNCGYGAAGKQFKIAAKNGLYGPPVDISIEDADAFVRLWREDNPHVTNRNIGYWKQCEDALRILAGGSTMDFGPLLLHMHKIVLPNGAMMNYNTLEWHVPKDDEECRDFERQGYWRMKTRQGWKKMWGSKLTQNICEAVSRVIVSQAMLRIKKQYGFRTLNWPYDELLLLFPRDGHEDKNLELCMAEMRREVSWLPGLPLDCEGSVSERYSK